MNPQINRVFRYMMLVFFTLAIKKEDFPSLVLS
jgi:hypothetical protein